MVLGDEEQGVTITKADAMKEVDFKILIIAAIGDLSVPFLPAPFSDKYSHFTMVISLLGNRNYHLHIVYNIGLVLAGIIFH